MDAAPAMPASLGLARAPAVGRPVLDVPPRTLAPNPPRSPKSSGREVADVCPGRCRLALLVATSPSSSSAPPSAGAFFSPAPRSLRVVSAVAAGVIRRLQQIERLLEVERLVEEVRRILRQLRRRRNTAFWSGQWWWGAAAPDLTTVATDIGGGGDGEGGDRPRCNRRQRIPVGRPRRSGRPMVMGCTRCGLVG